MNAEVSSRLLAELARVSAQAGVLVLLILVAQRICSRWLTPRARCVLWSLVVVRLLLPVSLPSGSSLFNLIPSSRMSPARATEMPGRFPAERMNQPSGRRASDGEEAVAADSPGREDRAMPAAPFPLAAAHPTRTKQGWSMLAVVWLTGIVGFLGWVSFQAVVTARRVRSWPEVTDPEVLRLLEECRERMAVRRPLRVRSSPELGSPALYGGLRPCLLLPFGFTARFSPAQLRLVFLHELAHIKCRDVWWNWVAVGLQALHWFNPLLWLGFLRWRADRELACDALTLEAAGEGHNREYARTILLLLESTRGLRGPGWIGMSGSARELRRRIVSIAEFEPGRRGAPLAILLIALLAAGALTDAQQTQAPKRPEPVLAIPTPVSAPDKSGKTVTPGTSALRGRVVDDRGEPVAGAAVYPMLWRGPAPAAEGVSTDAEGRFVIERAPAIGEYGVGKFGYFARQGLKLASAVDAEQVITLRQEMQVRGKVLDAETGKPVPAFVVFPGKSLPYRAEAQWEWGHELAGEAGTFEIVLSGKSLFMASLARLLVESPGYESGISDVFAVGSDVPSLEFHLHKAEPLRGVVLRPDGRAAGRAVLTLWAGELNMKDIPDRRRTDANALGEFSIPPSAAERVLVEHAAGFAELTLAQLRSSPRVSLQPGGTVKGTLRFRGQPVAGQRVWLSPVQYKYSRSLPSRLGSVPKTDRAGQFVFTSVPPGDYWAAVSRSRRLETSDGYAMAVGSSHGVPVTVLPGVPVEVTLGGGGSSVVGNATTEEEFVRTSWKNALGELWLELPAVPGQPHLADQDYPQTSERVTDAATMEFWRSEQGRARQRATRVYLAVFEEDGSFRIDDVPPGKYRFSLSVFDPGARKSGAFYAAHREVTVGEGTIDLGKVTARANRVLQ